MWAVVPVKEFAGAKQRLSPVLSPAERAKLYAEMLDRVLAMLLATKGLDGVAVVTNEARVARPGIRIIPDRECRGQSAAVAQGARVLAAEGASGILTIPGDVPLATPAEIELVLATHGMAWRAMTIVPSRDGKGTNALAVSPPALIPFHFGDFELRSALRGGARAGHRATHPAPARSRARHRHARRPRGPARNGHRMTGLREAMARAAALRDEGHGNVVTYSRKVFIPLTKLCRDVCHYCTFAQPPKRGERCYLTRDEVLAIARAGAAAGCHEALFTLGDKPELRYARRARRAGGARPCDDDLLPRRDGRAGARGDRAICRTRIRASPRRRSCSRCAASARRRAPCWKRRRSGCLRAAWPITARPTRSRPCASRGWRRQGGRACRPRPASSSASARRGTSESKRFRRSAICTRNTAISRKSSCRTSAPSPARAWRTRPSRRWTICCGPSPRRG